MKKLIAELPMLTAPKEKEELIIYLAAAKEAINAVLMTEREGNNGYSTFLGNIMHWTNPWAVRDRVNHSGIKKF
ncbi:hypothetical protein Tco_0126072 [Tanacetum coccineum]